MKKNGLLQNTNSERLDLKSFEGINIFCNMGNSSCDILVSLRNVTKSHNPDTKNDRIHFSKNIPANKNFISNPKISDQNFFPDNCIEKDSRFRADRFSEFLCEFYK